MLDRQEAGELGRLGSYRIKKLLGQGAMGMVFLAEDPSLQRQVAVKVMSPEAANHDKARDRFLREARSMAAVEHQLIIPLPLAVRIPPAGGVGGGEGTEGE